MKRLMSAALVAALGVTCLGGCQAGSTGGDTAVNGKGVKIYVSLSQADAFRNTLIDAAKKTAEASGAEIVVYDAENSIENQVAQIKQAVAEDYDAIMCGPSMRTLRWNWKRWREIFRLYFTTAVRMHRCWNRTNTFM